MTDVFINGISNEVLNQISTEVAAKLDPTLLEIATPLHFISSVWVPGILFFACVWLSYKYFWEG